SAQQQRQLERLQRELSQAAEQLRSQLSPEAAAALREAARQLGQMENQITKLEHLQRLQLQIAELKQVFSSRRPDRDQGGKSARTQAGGQNAPQRSGAWKHSRQMLDFAKRASQTGSNNALLLGPGGSSAAILPIGNDHLGTQPNGPGESIPTQDGIGDS